MISLYPSPVEALTDDTLQIQGALDRGADEILFAPGTYKISQPLTIKNSPIKLTGVRGLTILQFTGATDGLVFADSGLKHVIVEGLNIQAANTACGKAFNLACPNNGATNIVFRDVDITQTGSGLWAHGWYGDNWETSNVFSSRIESSTVVGVHVQNACNAVNFYGVEIAAGASSNRAVELAATGLDSQIFFHGGTMQGSFAQSLCSIAGASRLTLFNVHLENTNLSPSDGADLYNNASWLIISGGGSGSILTTGVSVLLMVLCEAADVTLGAASSASFIAVANLKSLTDNANNATVVGCRLTTGAQITNRVQGNTATAASAGANGAVPVQVAGYLIWNIGGTNYKIPYFNT